VERAIYLTLTLTINTNQTLTYKCFTLFLITNAIKSTYTYKTQTKIRLREFNLLHLLQGYIIQCSSVLQDTVTRLLRLSEMIRTSASCSEFNKQTLQENTKCTVLQVSWHTTCYKL